MIDYTLAHLTVGIGLCSPLLRNARDTMYSPQYSAEMVGYKSAEFLARMPALRP